MPLTDDQIHLVERVFMRGPMVLIEAKWSAEEIKDFLDNPEVRQHLELLVSEFNTQDAAHARVRFGIRRGIARLGRDAVGVYEKALSGPRYLRNNHGDVITGMHGNPIVLEPEPTPVQVKIASEVMDRLGVTPEGRSPLADRSVPDVNVKVIVGAARTVSAEVLEDPEATTVEDKALSRERIRNVIEVLSEKLPNLRKQLLGPAAPAKKKKTVKVSSPAKKVIQKKPVVKAKP